MINSNQINIFYITDSEMFQSLTELPTKINVTILMDSVTLLRNMSYYYKGFVWISVCVSNSAAWNQSSTQTTQSDFAQIDSKYMGINTGSVGLATSLNQYNTYCIGAYCTTGGILRVMTNGSNMGSTASNLYVFGSFYVGNVD